MEVTGIYGYHATKTGPKCSLVWMASCFVIPPSVKCRYLGTWDEINDELQRLENEIESDIIMPRMLTHADLHCESQDVRSYRVSPEPVDEVKQQTFEKEHEEYRYTDPVDEYLAEYADLLASKEKEENEHYQEDEIRPPYRGQTHEERRRTFVRRKSCPDASKTGLSLSLSVPKEQAIDDIHVNASMPSPQKPEKFSLKNITAMARRMSVPILDKSEDVDHGTKVLGETLIKKNRTTKQFREAFSEEPEDYIPHRTPVNLSKSLTSTEIESACNNLKSETPGSYKNVVTELKLRTDMYSDTKQPVDSSEHESENSGQNVSKSLINLEIGNANSEFEIGSPVHYRNVVKEFQEKKERQASDSHHSCDSNSGSLDYSFSDSFNSDNLQSLRRKKSSEPHCTNTYNRYSEPVRGDRFARIHAINDLKSHSYQTATPRQNEYNNKKQLQMQNEPKRNECLSMTLPLSDTNSHFNGTSTPKHNECTSKNKPRTQNELSGEDRFSKTLPASDLNSHFSGTSTPRHNEYNSNKSQTQKSDEPVSDLMRKLTNLTAQTRLATRPSLGNSEGYEPAQTSSMMRSQSVMNVSSPVMLSPKYDRNLLSSSFSSSTSSSSDITALSYHNVVDPCYRCWKTVYSLDKIGPIRKVLYHKQCFRCVTCNVMLTLNTYKQNANDKSDVQVYCKKHVPIQESPHISLEAKNLSVLMHHPKLDSVNTNIRGTHEDRRKSQNLNIYRARSTPRLDLICGPNDSLDTTTLDKNGNVSLRELKMDDPPKSVWSRSSFSAAKLDLHVPASGRKSSSLYRPSEAWNYM